MSRINNIATIFIAIISILALPSYSGADEAQMVSWKSALEDTVAKEAELPSVLIVLPFGKSLSNNLSYVSHSYAEEKNKILIKIKRADGVVEEINAKYSEAVSIPVLIVPLSKGDVITPENVSSIKFPKNRDTTHIIKDIEEVNGLVARKKVMAGRPMLISDFSKPTILPKGKIIKMAYIKNALSIETSAISLESGGEGDIIKVRGQDSNKVIQARVINEEMVVVNH